MADVQPYDFFKNIQIYHKDINDNFQQPSAIIPTLRSYQRKAVNWMVDREKNNNLLRSDGTPFSGGILADEIGLGKTLEMLCCIMSNMAPSEFYQNKVIFDEFKNVNENVIKSSLRPSTRKYAPYSKNIHLKTKQASDTNYKILKSQRKGVFSGMSTVSNNKIDIDEDDSKLMCYCNENSLESTIVYCINCSKGQHSECVHFELKPLQEVPFLCAECWTVNDKFQCRATLIVVPQSILNQWIKEIKKHIKKPGLSVYIYNGVHIDGYTQPITFNDYDVVITSYNNLSKDLDYVESNYVDSTSRLRQKKKYYYPKSPLPCIKWWRICLDEAQVIESTTCKVSEMTSCLQSVHKWSMTGTPIQNSINDLYGILKFLDVTPYCNRKQFLQLINGESTNMYNWFSNLIWRNLMEDVNSEINIPNQTYITHWLKFSEIETFFYETQRNVCAENFIDIITKSFASLDISVKSIYRQDIEKILGPLYTLRQACIHPQVANGEFLKIKEIMTMENVRDIMVEKSRVKCNEKLHRLIIQHNTVAEIYFICNKKQDAINYYITVLMLMKKYSKPEENLKIDICEQICVLHNLTSLLKDGISLQLPTDCEFDLTELSNDLVQLEENYLAASKQNIKETKKNITSYLVKVNTLLRGEKSLLHFNCWFEILNCIILPMSFLRKIRLELEEYRVSGVPNIANRFKSIHDVHHVLNNWLFDLNTERDHTIALMNTLEETPVNELVYSVSICYFHDMHLKRVFRLVVNKCILCKVEVQLQSYESLLFCISNKKKYMLHNTTENDEEKTMYESTSKGSWKMSQNEFLLKKLYQYGKTNIRNKNCLNSASNHLKVLELLRKEFRYLRLFCTHFSNWISLHDELIKAKQSQRTLDPNIFEVNDFVNNKMEIFKTDILNTKGDLENEVRKLLFLQNLKKENANSTEIQPCPICDLNDNPKWAVFTCGHSVCNQCLTSLFHHSHYINIQCPLCRITVELNSISYVRNTLERANIIGSFSTKIENVVVKLIELIAQDPTVKVLIFSTWEIVLNLLDEALEQNSINHRVLKSGITYTKTLRDFKKNWKINVLLMKLSLGSKGLNLSEASRIFFMEPIMNKEDELQAIGRIYRIGQTKPIFVHNFVVRDSIEENITKLFTSENSNRWNNTTLSDLVKIFY